MPHTRRDRARALGEGLGAPSPLATPLPDGRPPTTQGTLGTAHALGRRAASGRGGGRLCFELTGSKTAVSVCDVTLVLGTNHTPTPAWTDTQSLDSIRGAVPQQAPAAILEQVEHLFEHLALSRSPASAAVVGVRDIRGHGA